MEGMDFTYVNGEGPYQGNILLDPDGTVTRAEMYDAIAEVNRPVTIERVSFDPGIGGYVLMGLIVLCLLAIVGNLGNISKRLP